MKVKKNKRNKIFIVKQWECCECDPPCDCRGYNIDTVFYSQKKAKKRADELWNGFVNEYTIQE